jgi:predicted permease
VNEDLRIVLGSVVEVFGLVAVAYLYARRLRPDMDAAMRLSMHLFIPCLAFTAILRSELAAGEVAVAAAATLIQIGSGLLLGWLGLRLLGLGEHRELLLPIAFVNSANIPFPLLLANFGTEGLSRGVLCYTVTNLMIFSVGIVLLHGGGRMREALREPALWATGLAGVLRLLGVKPTGEEVWMRVPQLAATAAVPMMLILFGDALARTKLTSVPKAAAATLLRYASGLAGLALTLWLLRPEGMLRKVLILYALLPSAVVNVVLTQRAGRDEQSVASAVLLATLVGVVLLPILLAVLR